MSGIKKQVVIGFCLLALLTVAKGVNHESMQCSNDNTPICARSQNEYLLFKNECDLRKAQRENLMGGPLFDVSLKNCLPSCEFECDDGFHPICGVSVVSGERNTFRNRCEMTRTACFSKSDWLVYKWGVCPTVKSQRSKQSAHTVAQRKPRQSIPCTNVYRPVCASYAGVKSTFSNECLVTAENNRTGRNWRVISEGLCGEDSTKMKHSRKYKPKSKPKVEIERSKRSHKQLNQLDDFEISQDAVEIFAPSTFHTQFISNSGTMEKSYSLPARKPYLDASPKARRIYGSTIYSRNGQMHTQFESESLSIRKSGKPCVFSNEPVCGSFNGESRTFSNVCELMEYSQAEGNVWTILYDGTCRNCDKPCPTVYSPICANRNGINYTIINECYLERVRCKDPNSDWKISHKGECTHLNEQVSQSIPQPSQKPLSSIPSMLYTSKLKENSNSTSTPKPITRTPLSSSGKATSNPRRKFRKLRRTTPTPKDLSNRKIRKIEHVSFDGFDPNMPIKEAKAIKMPTTSKLWAAKDNWLLHQNLDDVKNKFNKRPNSKKAHSEKYPHYSWPMTPTVLPELLFTTTELTSVPAMLNVGLNSDEKIIVETKTSSEIPIDLEPTTIAKTDKPELSIGSSSTIAPHTTYVSADDTSTITPTTTSSVTTTTETTKVSTTTNEIIPMVYETSTMIIPSTKPEASTNTPANIGTTEALDRSTTKGTVDTTDSTASMETSTVSSEMSTMLNLDYNVDAPLQNQGEQTSIYGLDKNSLIMRLLRARSSKNVSQ